jgi:oligopeptide transport system permease protein
MLRYIVRRTLQIIPVFFIATFIIFVIVWVLPGDPIQAQFGERTVPENTRAAYEERYNLDDSVPVQYWKYITGIIFEQDFGESLRTQRPVTELFKEAFPRTLRLASMAVFFEACMAIPIGIYSARRRGGWFDNGSLVSTIVLLSIPPFVMLAVLQLVVGVKWGLLPVSGIDEGLKSYVLPAFGIAIGAMAASSRLMRASLIETYQEDYIKTARAKGANERRVLGVHALRNAFIPVVTVLGITLGALIGGTIVTESIFQIPGVGFQIARSITSRDGFVIVGVSTILVVLYLIINLIVDVLYALLDPRIRYD